MESNRGKLSAYYRLGITSEEKNKLYEICSDDMVAFELKKCDGKSFVFDKLVKVVVGATAIVATCAMAILGTKNLGLIGNNDRQVTKYKDMVIPDGYTTYNIKVLGTSENIFAMPEEDYVMDYWLINETDEDLKSICESGKTKKEIMKEISYEKLAKLKILDVSKSKTENYKSHYKNVINRYNLFYILNKSHEEWNVAGFAEGLEDYAKDIETSYDVTLLLKKDDLEKIKKNEVEYGKLEYLDFVITYSGFDSEDVVYHGTYSLRGEGFVGYTINARVTSDVKEDDVVDVICRDTDSGKELYRVQDAKILAISDETSGETEYANVTIEIKKETANKLIVLENKQDKPIVWEFVKK